MKPIAGAPATPDDDRHVPLALTADEFRRIGHDLIDAVAEILSTYRDRPLTPDESPAELKALIGGDRRLPGHGESPGALIESSVQPLRDHSLFNGPHLICDYNNDSPAPLRIRVVLHD